MQVRRSVSQGRHGGASPCGAEGRFGRGQRDQRLQLRSAQEVPAVTWSVEVALALAEAWREVQDQRCEEAQVLRRPLRHGDDGTR